MPTPDEDFWDGKSQGLRVLVVEDDPSSRWLLSAVLHRLGHECRVASNGVEALEQVESFEPDLILMDLMMPVLDGVETTRRLKAGARTRGIPIFVLTGDATVSGERAAQQAGCDEFLTKPVLLPELLGRMEAYFAS